VGADGFEPLPCGRDLQSRCRIRTAFVTQFVGYRLTYGVVNITPLMVLISNDFFVEDIGFEPMTLWM
jgi:hypothetical protein